MSRAMTWGSGVTPGGRSRSAARQPVVAPVRAVRGAEAMPGADNPFRAKSPANRRVAAQVYIIAREKAGRPVSPSVRAIAESRA